MAGLNCSYCTDTEYGTFHRIDSSNIQRCIYEELLMVLSNRGWSRQGYCNLTQLDPVRSRRSCTGHMLTPFFTTKPLKRREAVCSHYCGYCLVLRVL
jgi:L-lysine 2,3-aminomutase